MEGLGAGGAGGITQGYSKSGAEEFKNELNNKAITETANILRETAALKQAFQAGWQGQSEVAFEKNLDTAVENTAQGLEGLKSAMDTEFANIAASFDDFDNNLITED